MSKNEQILPILNSEPSPKSKKSPCSSCSCLPKSLKKLNIIKIIGYLITVITVLIFIGNFISLYFLTWNSEPINLFKDDHVSIEGSIFNAISIEFEKLNETAHDPGINIYEATFLKGIVTFYYTFIDMIFTVENKGTTPVTLSIGTNNPHNPQQPQSPQHLGRNMKLSYSMNSYDDMPINVSLSCDTPSYDSATISIGISPNQTTILLICGFSSVIVFMILILTFCCCCNGNMKSLKFAKKSKKILKKLNIDLDNKKETKETVETLMRLSCQFSSRDDASNNSSPEAHSFVDSHISNVKGRHVTISQTKT